MLNETGVDVNVLKVTLGPGKSVGTDTIWLCVSVVLPALVNQRN